MATNSHNFPQFFIFLSITLATCNLARTHSDHAFSTKLSKESLGLQREKFSHLRFYFHDIVSGPHPTAIPVASAPTTNASLSKFGLVSMMDDPLTLGPEPSSMLVGRAQGIYASAAQAELSFLMAMNFAFTEGKYNGSNLSVLGRNSVFSGIREMPIVGGSGLFRFARGYAQAMTHQIDFKTGDAVVEYNMPPSPLQSSP